MNGDVLESFYQEALEERIVRCLSERLDISLRKAMDLYYHSELAKKIHAGANDIQYLDYRVLTEVLCNAESALVKQYI